MTGANTTYLQLIVWGPSLFFTVLFRSSLSPDIDFVGGIFHRLMRDASSCYPYTPTPTTTPTTSSAPTLALQEIYLILCKQQLPFKGNHSNRKPIEVQALSGPPLCPSWPWAAAAVPRSKPPSNKTKSQNVTATRVTSIVTATKSRH